MHTNNGVSDYLQRHIQRGAARLLAMLAIVSILKAMLVLNDPHAALTTIAAGVSLIVLAMVLLGRIMWLRFMHRI